ncbi:MAG TPA: FtsQ-type POTRA domain-containing protein, partial [Anaerolineales bacterium]|nr:FtsQ-type POTRA domain-containing protein [Anaerolineales bacterium]
MSDNKDLTRSELVRLRREKEKAKRMERAMREATRPVPITTCAKPEAAKPVRKSAQKARRRFQIALPLPRKEFRSFRIPRPRLGWRSLSFLLVVVFGAAIFFAFQRLELRVTEAQVIGNQMLTPAEVNAVLNVAGQPIFLLIPSELETRLRINYPELASVDVNVSLPNLVTVKLLERKPVIRWEQGG